jgi:hypothetical protein
MEILYRNNWYIRYAINQELLKEAGWKENIATGLLAAILSVFSGSTIYAASLKNNVKPEELTKALQNQELVMQAKQMQNKTHNEVKPKTELTKPKAPNVVEKEVSSQTKIDEIVNAIIQHEGLMPKQTPFRITNPSMKNWTTIHGFKIDRTTPKPKGRENFIYLVNASDVPKAIKKQLARYANNPARYNLSAKPSLKEALQVFDQTGVRGKLNFLQERFPSLNVNQTLSSLFG